MRSLLLVLVTVFAMVGCASPGPTVLTWEGPEANRANFLEAVNEWSKVCGSSVVAGPGGVPVSESDEGIEPGKSGTTLMHGTEPVYIHVRADYATRALLAHEIGHAIGLNHAPGLMTEGTIPKDAHVTQTECEALDEAHDD